MKIGDEVYVHGYVDEVRKGTYVDIVIIRNKGGYFGTDASEVISADRKTEPQNYCDDCLYTDTCDSKEFFYACTSKATISKMEQVEDEPQTEDKHAVCTGCDYYDLPNAFHPCASCVDFSKYKPKIETEPQTDCPWK